MRSFLIAIGLVLLFSGFKYPVDSKLSKDIKRVLNIDNPKFRRIEALNESKNGFFTEIESASKSEIVGYYYSGRVFTCNNTHCSTEITESEYLDYIIIFNKQASVLMVKVVEYNATHGHAVTAKGWLSQFIGYAGSKSLNVGTNIDAISGATISAEAITYDIERVTRVLANFCKK